VDSPAARASRPAPPAGAARRRSAARPRAGRRLSLKLRHREAYQRGLDRDDLTALATGSTADRARLGDLAEIYGEMLARAHGQARTEDGVLGATVIAPLLAGRDAAFVDDIVQLATQDAAQVIAESRADEGPRAVPLIFPRSSRDPHRDDDGPGRRDRSRARTTRTAGRRGTADVTPAPPTVEGPPSASPPDPTADRRPAPPPAGATASATEPAARGARPCHLSSRRGRRRAWRSRLELTSHARYASKAGTNLSELRLDRGELGARISLGRQAAAELRVEAIRSALEGGALGIDGDSTVVRVKYASVGGGATFGPLALDGAFGFTPDPWIRTLEDGYTLKPLSRTGSERLLGWATSDLAGSSARPWAGAALVAVATARAHAIPSATLARPRPRSPRSSRSTSRRCASWSPPSAATARSGRSRA